MRELRPQSLYPPGGRGGWLVAAAREVIWANLGVLDEPAGEPPTVVFVSTDGASNGRRLVNEEAVAEAVRAVVASARPQWRFRRQRLEQLSYENEVRLLRSTRLFICLFSAALTNCQFLPPGAIVLQIHGALRGEIGFREALHQYRAQFCTRRIGLRWAGFAAHGWRRKYPEETSHEDFSHARVDPARFARFVGRALDGQWSVISREFVDSIGRAVNRSDEFDALAREVVDEAKAPDPRETRPFVFE